MTTAAHPIKALLSLYDEAYQRLYGVRAPIVSGKDAKLAASVQQYTLAQHAEYLEAFMAHPDPFIQQSGHTFGVYVSCLGKLIAFVERRKRNTRVPPAPVVELAKSMARQRAAELDEGHAWLREREAQLTAAGLSLKDAQWEAGREWLKKQ